jgi:hydrogenase maturation factor
MLLVTKGVPIEATAIIARERADMLKGMFTTDFIARCANFLHEPGISVVRDAALAIAAGRVHAMHDPTEGGLATGLWEMAEAAERRLIVDCSGAVIDEGGLLCGANDLDPMGAIASGALLMAVHPEGAENIQTTLKANGIPAHQIGHVEDGAPAVIDTSASVQKPLPRPSRDEIAKLFEQ